MPVCSRRARGLVVALLVLAGCGDFFEAVGADEATRITIDAEIPAFVSLPQEALPASPVAGRVEVVVPLPMNLVTLLREQGRHEEADLIEKERDRLEVVDLREVEYEVVDPNRLPVAVGPVALEVGPFALDDADSPDARLLGRTVGVPAERTIATRELDYVVDGRASASAFLEALEFTLVARTRLEVEPGRPIPADALKMRLTFKLRVKLRLTD